MRRPICGGGDGIAELPPDLAGKLAVLALI